MPIREILWKLYFEFEVKIHGVEVAVFKKKFHNDIDYDITPQYFKQHIVTAVNQLFGEVAASVDIDVLKYSPTCKRAILRVPTDHYVKIRSSLTLCGDYQSDICSYSIHKASPQLLNLQGDSREFTF